MMCPKHHDTECKEGRYRCEVCLENLREYQRARRNRLIDAGLCVGTVARSKCKNKPRECKTMCQTCADTFNKYQSERIAARKKETE